MTYSEFLMQKIAEATTPQNQVATSSGVNFTSPVTNIDLPSFKEVQERAMEDLAESQSQPTLPVNIPDAKEFETHITENQDGTVNINDYTGGTAKPSGGNQQPTGGSGNQGGGNNTAPDYFTTLGKNWDTLTNNFSNDPAGSLWTFAKEHPLLSLGVGGGGLWLLLKALKGLFN